VKTISRLKNKRSPITPREIINSNFLIISKIKITGGFKSGLNKERSKREEFKRKSELRDRREKRNV